MSVNRATDADSITDSWRIELKIITYSLLDENGNSDSYYHGIRSLTDEVVKKASVDLKDELHDITVFIKGKDTLNRSFGDLMIEATALGILWNAYGGIFSTTLPGLRPALALTTKIRGKANFLKPVCDKLKGVLITVAVNSRRQQKQYAVPNVRQIENLLGWLQAIGDFEQEAGRLKLWAAYFSSFAKEKAETHIRRIMDFARWFEKECGERLGEYTTRVESFIEKKRTDYRWREDAVYCLRKPAEYYLNMVGAEIMSREYRQSFLKAEKKEIFLPVCMRSLPDNQCRAVRNHHALVCGKCTAGCMVKQVTELGEKYGYSVSMIPHESDVSARRGHYGIVGISCVTRLIEGGWKAAEMGLSPQCVLLDYCGCSKHWDKAGIPTAINLSRLEKVMRADLDD